MEMISRSRVNEFCKIYFAIAATWIVVLFSGCASQLAKPIDESIETIPGVSLVKQNLDGFVGKRVRWGGVIASVVNEKQTTLIEIVSRTLDMQGRPVDTDESDGRFLARVNGFLDPVIYANGRNITVVGSITGIEMRLINEFEYHYPAVRVDNFKLWQTLEERPMYYYDPFWFGPWYPYYSRPYYPYRYKQAQTK